MNDDFKWLSVSIGVMFILMLIMFIISILLLVTVIELYNAYSELYGAYKADKKAVKKWMKNNCPDGLKQCIETAIN